MKLKERAAKLKTEIPAVFLALRKKQTPLIAKIAAAITIAYALSPVDLIPDFIPVLGYLDDIILLPAMIALTVKLIPKEIFRECVREAEDLWNDVRPKKWYFALPVIVIWVIMIVSIVGVLMF